MICAIKIHVLLTYLLTYSTDSSGLFTDTSEHIRLYFLVFKSNQSNQISLRRINIMKQREQSEYVDRTQRQYETALTRVLFHFYFFFGAVR